MKIIVSPQKKRYFLWCFFRRARRARHGRLSKAQKIILNYFSCFFPHLSPSHLARVRRPIRASLVAKKIVWPHLCFSELARDKNDNFKRNVSHLTPFSR